MSVMGEAVLLDSIDFGAIKKMVSSEEISANQESCLLVFRSHVTAEAWLHNQHCYMLGVCGLLGTTYLAKRNDSGRTQAALQLDPELQLISKPTFGEQLPLMAARVVMETTVFSEEDCVDIAVLRGAGLCRTAVCSRPHDPVTASGSVRVAVVLGIWHALCCLVRRDAATGSEPSHCATHRSPWQAISDHSACPACDKALDHGADAPRPRQAVERLRHYDNVSAAQPDADDAAVEAGPAHSLAGTVDLSVPAKSLPHARPLRHSSEIKPAPLPAVRRAMRSRPQSTRALRSSLLPEQTAAQPAVVSAFSGFPRSMSLPSLATQCLPHAFVVQPCHFGAPMPRAHLLSVNACAAADVHLQLLCRDRRLTSLVSHTVTCTGAATVYRDCAVSPTLCQTEPGNAQREGPGFGCVSTKVGALAALEKEGKFPAAPSLQRCDRRADAYAAIVHLSGAADAESVVWAVDAVNLPLLGKMNQHLPRAGLQPYCPETRPAALSHAVDARRSPAPRPSAFRFSGLPELTAAVAATYAVHRMLPRSKPSRQPSPVYRALGRSQLPRHSATCPVVPANQLVNDCNGVNGPRTVDFQVAVRSCSAPTKNVGAAALTSHLPHGFRAVATGTTVRPPPPEVSRLVHSLTKKSAGTVLIVASTALIAATLVTSAVFHQFLCAGLPRTTLLSGLTMLVCLVVLLGIFNRALGACSATGEKRQSGTRLQRGVQGPRGCSPTSHGTGLQEAFFVDFDQSTTGKVTTLML
jgi:hypothetical protein